MLPSSRATLLRSLYVLSVAFPDAVADGVCNTLQLGKPLTNFGVSKVVRSESSSFKAGDHLYGTHEFSEYQIFDAEALKGMRLLENTESLPWTVRFSAFRKGAKAESGFFLSSDLGWCCRNARPDGLVRSREHCQAQEGGDDLHLCCLRFVSSKPRGFARTPDDVLPGAVGQMVAGLCQRLGLRVIGSAGSDEKVAFLKDVLKFDVAFNYKTEDTQVRLSFVLVCL